MTNLLSGTIHDTVPPALGKALLANPEALAIWNTLTPLARNEWICWTIAPKRQTTRKEHVERVVSELLEGMRRPCCWIGCIHRTDKEVAPSIRGILDKKSKK
ncbi:MAG: YdeI/OmpD-associated family protein [Candidatus Saccharimonadales bacterium]